MLHVVGEILVDKFIDGKNETFFAGGAPFNVAANANALGADVSFYGAVGKDEYGKFLKKYARREKFTYLDISYLSKRYTTEAVVTLVNAERSFKFKRDFGADYALNLSHVNKLNISKGDIFHIGSLMLSFPRGRKFFYKAIELAKAKGALISFDVNYRDDIFESSTQAKRIFKKAIAQADFVKLSDEELNVLTNKKRLISQLKALLKPNQTAFISLGKKGSVCYHNDKLVSMKTIEVKPVDTTGAGDAFYSYVLYSLSKDKSFLNNDEKIKKMLFGANYVGAHATLEKGALIANKLTSADVDKFVGENYEKI